MFRNYLAAALRNLLRNRLYTAINVAGLAVGFAVALLIALFIRDELSYDRFFADSDRIYRIYGTGSPPVTGVNELSETEGDVSQWLPLEFPQIERAVSFLEDKRAIRHGDFEVEENLTWAGKDFFQIFRPPGGRWSGHWLVAGDPVAALASPNGVVLTRSMARKYFGKDDAVGGVLELDRKTPLRVGAVIDDLPTHTHLKLGMVVGVDPDFWKSTDWPYAYVKLAANASAAQIERGMHAAIDRHMPLKSIDGGGGKTLKWRGTQAMYLLPLDRVHLHRKGDGTRFDRSRDLRVVGALGAIGALIVLVAVINFVNLMTARASRRAIEVGIRKAAGARRGDGCHGDSGRALSGVRAVGISARCRVERRCRARRRRIRTPGARDPAVCGADRAHRFRHGHLPADAVRDERSASSGQGPRRARARLVRQNAAGEDPRLARSAQRCVFGYCAAVTARSLRCLARRRSTQARRAEHGGLRVLRNLRHPAAGGPAARGALRDGFDPSGRRARWLIRHHQR
jgi:hypothetical protein